MIGIPVFLGSAGHPPVEDEVLLIGCGNQFLFRLIVGSQFHLKAALRQQT